MEKSKQSGQILILALVVIAIVLANTLIIIGGSLIYFQNSNYSLESNEAVNLAEAGVDKALNSLNVTAGSYTGESETIFGDGSFAVSVTSPDPGTRIIQSTGYIPSKDNPKVKRTITITAAKGVGVSFSQAVLVGNGGLTMGNNSIVTGTGGVGSVYSNGNVVMSNNATVQGDLIVAGGVAPSPDQQTDCSGGSCADYVLGKTINGQNIYDIAQSFKPSSNSVLSKLSIKLEKIGNPADLTVKILADSSGKPDKNQVLASSTIPAGMVLDTYSFVDASFAAPPNLTANTTYWIMLITSGDNTNYWAWQQDTAGSYFSGSPAWSSNWQAKSPVWTAITGDLSFKTYMGGVATYVQGTNGAAISGNARANTMTGVTIGKDAYYQSQSNIIVSGSNCTNNSHCHPGSPDPGPAVMPITDAMISNWESTAQLSGVYNGDINNCVATFGPGKYVGNVTFSNNCVIDVKTPIWITGNLTLSNSNQLTLDSSYGTDSGVIVINGQIILNNGNSALGTGQGSSYLVLLSTYDSVANANANAISLNNGGNTGVLYASNGIIDISNGNTLLQVTGYQMKLENNVTINYNSGLSSLFVTSGPGGTFNLVKGTYQLK